MEFVWDDGSHAYPDEYPEENADVNVEGTFETYTESGGLQFVLQIEGCVDGGGVM